MKKAKRVLGASLAVVGVSVLGWTAWGAGIHQADRLRPGTREERGAWLCIWGDYAAQWEKRLCYGARLYGCRAAEDSYDGWTMTVMLVEVVGQQRLGTIRVDMENDELTVRWAENGDATILDLREGNIVDVRWIRSTGAHDVKQRSGMVLTREQMEELLCK